MPRKATALSSVAPAEPRRSSRIKEQPKVEAAPKKAAKPRPKKAKPVDEKEGEAQEQVDDTIETTKPKSTKGRKRTANDKDAEETAEPLPAQVEEAPPSKKNKPESKPASKAAGKPESKAAADKPEKPASKATKPSSRASAKPASTVKKPASRAGSRKPVSKAGAHADENAAPVLAEPIMEEPEGEAITEADEAD